MRVSCATAIALQVSVVGGLAYMSCRNKGLRIVDVSDPTAPVEIGSFNTPGPGFVYDVSVVGGLAYVA